jgi:hypothetical protein
MTCFWVLYSDWRSVTRFFSVLYIRALPANLQILVHRLQLAVQFAGITCLQPILNAYDDDTPP